MMCPACARGDHDGHERRSQDATRSGELRPGPLVGVMTPCHDSLMTTTTIYLDATEHAGSPLRVKFTSERYATAKDAQQVAGTFPKSAKMRAHSVYDSATSGFFGMFGAVSVLQSNGVNGGVNETGIKRYVSIVRAAKRLGMEIVYRPLCANSYPSREAFEAAVGVA